MLLSLHNAQGHTLDWLVTRINEDGLLINHTVDMNEMSDHAIVSCKLNLTKPKLVITSSTSRNYGRIDHTTFANDLSDQLRYVCHDGNVDKFLNDIDNVITTVLDVHAPKSSCSKPKCHRPKWYNNSIDEAIRERRRAERKWRKSISHADRIAFDTAKRTVCGTLVTVKCSFYKESLTNSTPKIIFRTINELIGNIPQVPTVSISPTALANEFSKFFTDKVKNIRLYIDDQYVDEQLSVTLPSPDCQLSDFHPVSSDELLKIVQRSTTKSCQLDPIPTSLFKRHIMTFLPKLTEVVNASLRSGVFPESLRDAVITPILKKPSLDKEDLKNYRPVSNIRYLCKVIETVVCSQITQYLDHKLLEPLQSAYRVGHSTETALLRVHNDILRAIDNRRAVFLVMPDLSAAFDTLDHNVMLQCFHDRFGITGTALQWFSSYFTGRTVSGSRCRC